MSSDAEYLAKYLPNKLHIQPTTQGTYAKILDESEETLIGEVNVTTRCKLAISAFYVRDRGQFNTLKITKLKFHARRGWEED